MSAESPDLGRIWFYSNYHCNLTCTYCLTESGPRSERRRLDPGLILELATAARALGFTGLGVTGGEPFLRPDLPRLLAQLATCLPVVVLTNGTLFGSRLLDRLSPLAGLPVALQISLDSAEPSANDEMRGPHNFAKVVEAIPRLRGMGIRVRMATTGDGLSTAGMARLCRLHRSLGIPDEDHVVRPVVKRGRALTNGLGIEAVKEDLPAELTITADGAFWSPFGPTVVDGRLDTDLLLTRTVRPLSLPLRALTRAAGGRPVGDVSGKVT
jgi:MoaA/NifB/PqqE/SkfB family radical SAM enzyme